MPEHASLARWIALAFGLSAGVIIVLAGLARVGVL